MAALGESGPDANADDPFARLGLSRDAGFEQVQAAKSRCLAEVSGDDQARAKVDGRARHRGEKAHHQVEDQNPHRKRRENISVQHI